MTAEDVALFLKISVSTIRRFTMNKEIPYHKINRAVRFKKSEIERWVDNNEFSSGEEKSETMGGVKTVLENN